MVMLLHLHFFSAQLNGLNAQRRVVSSFFQQSLSDANCFPENVERSLLFLRFPALPRSRQALVVDYNITSLRARRERRRLCCHCIVIAKRWATALLQLRENLGSIASQLRALRAIITLRHLGARQSGKITKNMTHAPECRSLAIMHLHLRQGRKNQIEKSSRFIENMNARANTSAFRSMLLRPSMRSPSLFDALRARKNRFALDADLAVAFALSSASLASRMRSAIDSTSLLPLDELSGLRPYSSCRILPISPHPIPI